MTQIESVINVFKVLVLSYTAKICNIIIFFCLLRCITTADSEETVQLSSTQNFYTHKLLSKHAYHNYYSTGILPSCVLRDGM